MRVGIIGCGNIFPMHSQSVHMIDGAELVAVCDNKEDRAITNANYYKCKYYTDYKKMIDNEDIDVVHICTPHYLHAEMAIYAANAKKHVLTEKPMSIALADAQAMIKAAKENGVTLGVIFQNHYNPGAALIKKTLDNGELGKVLSARLSVTWDRSDEYYSKSDWKGTWDKEGGGVIIDQAIHTMDMIRWFINSDIEYVDSNIANRTHTKIEVEDEASGVIKFKNGVIVGFYCMNYFSYDAPVEIEIHCEKGIIKMIGDKGVISFHDGHEVVADKNPNEIFEYFDGYKEYWGVSHVKQIKEFYEDLKNGRKPVIDGEYAVKTQELICAVYESGKNKERVVF